MSDHADWTYTTEPVGDRHALCCRICRAAEARVTELEAALTEISEPMPENEGDWGSTYDWEKSAKARRDIARAALAAPTKEGT